MKEFDYGVIVKEGPRQNMTDCETDIVLIHVSTGKWKRFHGSYYDKNFEREMNFWIKSFPKTNKDISVTKLQKYYSTSTLTLIPWEFFEKEQGRIQ